MGVLQGCKPREEVLKGDLDDAIFAADFGDVVVGKAPEVYSDPRKFFLNTHPAKPLCQVVQAVFGRLANPKEPGATIRLSTGFGGGKTHTLIALWHLARNVADPGLGTELLPAAGRPKSVTVVGVDAGKAGTTVFRRHGDVEVRSLWGEVAWWLGGEGAWRLLGAADHPEAQPDEEFLATLFPEGPVLILFDELVQYMATLSERGQGNLLAFLNKLASIVSKRPQTVLIVTDPADQRVYAKEAGRIGDALTAAAVKLDDLFGRRMTDFDPIGDEAPRVIVRRLFEWVDPVAAQKASATYHALYRRVLDELPGVIPPEAAGPDYARRIVECYPFHPRLLETAQNRLGVLQAFQKSRGVLRLFARIVRDVWESGEDVELITAGEINWSSPRIQADLLQRLNRDDFKAAISADIEKHASALDGGPRGFHRRVASALLLESLPLQSNSGMDASEVTLAVLRPDEAGPEPGEALERLVGICWHTYPRPGGRGWQFRYEPNVNRLIEERAGRISPEDARSRVLAEAHGYFSGPVFKLAPFPVSARQVPESADLQLVLCESEELARSVCMYCDDTNPEAPIPRRFQNAIVAVAPTPASFSEAVEKAKRLLAAEEIEREYRTGEANRLTREQLQRVKPEIVKSFRIQTYRAFDRVVFAGGKSYTIEEQYQVPDEELLQRPQGQACLRRFLEAKNLIYRSGDALDTLRFVRDILRGTTPLPDQPGVYTARAIHERFLSAPNLRLIPDGSIVRETIKRALAEGKVVVRFSDGRVYDSKGCVEGPEGGRRRTSGSITSLPLDESVLVALSESEVAAAWVREDERGATDTTGIGPAIVPPPPLPPPEVASWEKAVEQARERVLLELRLVAADPGTASMLVELAHPLGAETLSLSVSVGGTLKDGGKANFSASGLKPSHPIRPLAKAHEVFNALVPDGRYYEAEVVLGFGARGRAGMGRVLEELAEKSPPGLRVKARFATGAGDAV